MNWDAIGAIGEVVGALGVIVTLAYLAIQIRQNTASARVSTTQAILEAVASFSDLCASDMELGRVFLDGIENQTSLSRDEKIRFHFLMMSYMRRMENFYQQGESSYLPAKDWAGIRLNFFEVLVQPGSQAWWKKYSTRFNSHFATWASEEVSKIAASSLPESVLQKGPL
jgi:hypothetical protein